jgi:hypothetical protein
MGGFSSMLTYGNDLLDALTWSTGTGAIAWLLAAVFALSGSVKLRRPVLAAMAFVDFGVARRVHGTLGWSLGIGELTLAVALIVAPRFGGMIATVLLWFFVVLIARSLRAGGRFACFCFGDSNASLSRWTLIRTAALALLATDVAIAAPGVGAVGSDTLIQAVVAAGLLGTVALLGYLPRLLRLNADPFGEHRQEVQA